MVDTSPRRSTNSSITVTVTNDNVVDGDEDDSCVLKNPLLLRCEI